MYNCFGNSIEDRNCFVSPSSFVYTVTATKRGV